MGQFNISRSYSQTYGEKLGAFVCSSYPNGSAPYDLVVQAGVSNQMQLLSVSTAALQFLFINSTQPITIGLNGVNAQHTIVLGGGYTAGTFTLTYGGQTTTALAFNATAAQVQAALQALSSVGLNNVLVTGTPGSYVLQWTGTLGVQPITSPTYTSSLTGGSPTITVTPTITGVVPVYTWTLPANQAVDWMKGDIWTNPLTTAGITTLTSLAITNAGYVAATVNFRAGVN